MFIDHVEIHIKAGNGGNGAVSFRREKYVAAGGPDGGDGGRGGNVVFRVDEGCNTLLAFRYRRKFVAGNGDNGGGAKFHGKNGEDVVIPVPPGTLLRNPADGRIIHDMSSGGDYIAAVGGRGGWGNRHFATPTRQIPRFAKGGTEGEEFDLLLELKMLADVGLIGYPSVGKSSILARISAARPKIADYHFTTLSPNLGVVQISEGQGFVAADIPGLIEGAADGAGLGHDFLRHIDRCRLLLHVVDIAATEGRDPVEDVKKIDEELRRYSPELASRPQIMVGNKADLTLVEEEPYTAAFEEYVRSLGREIFYVSAATGEGLRELCVRVAERLRELPPPVVYDGEITKEELLAKPENALETTVRRENDTWYVEGEWLRNFMGQINFGDYESMNFFQKVLTKNGVFDLLRARGIEEGHTVNIYDFEFEFVY